MTVSLCVPAVMGALESRGVLRRMSDMLEVLMKRMDILARLENSTDFHKGDEARFPLDRSVGRADAPCSPRGAAPGWGGLWERRTPMRVGVVEPTGAWGRSFALSLFANFWKPFTLGFLKFL